MTRAIVIDSVAREVREIELPDLDVDRLALLQEIVGGYLEAAYMWPHGDVLFVDEDGDRNAPRIGFVFRPMFIGDDAVFRGNGVIVGREVSGSEDWAHLSPVITVEQIKKVLGFWGGDE